MENNEDLFSKLNKLDQSDEKIQIEKSLLLKSALTGTNAEDIFKAQKYLKTIQQNTKVQEPKSLFLDPLMLSGTGYRQRAVNLSYNTLRLMARVPQIRAIIETRKEQIARFCSPQKDKYSTGFVIRPKQSNADSKSKELTNQQLKEIEQLTNFIIHCGNPERIYTGDDFQTFSRKVLDDSLILDQCTAEIIFTNGGDIYEFRATDAATYRYSELKDETDEKYDDKRVNGFLPSHVQVYQERIISEFYPWELMFGIRNPKTDIYQNGYGRGELEDLIETVTSLLNAGQYNSNFFKVGSNPKGILKVSGDFNPSTLEEFKTQWQAQLAGTKNSHKLPIINAEKMDFVSTQQSNKDMEFSAYNDFLLKTACALYKIDPEEIGFPMGRGSEGKAPAFEGSNEHRLKYSRDRGLKPLLEAYQFWLNKWVMYPKTNSKYELVFVGIDEFSAEQELESDIKALQNFETVNEVRKRRGLEPLEGYDMILNPVSSSMVMQQKQMDMMGGNMNNPNQQEEENPIQKALEKDLEKLFS